MKYEQVCVLGEGAWGTAIATLLAHNGYQVSLWCHDAQVSETMASTRYNSRYLPGIFLQESIAPTTSLAEAVSDVQWIFQATPIQFLRSVLDVLKSHMKPSHRLAMLNKGIEQKSLLLPGQMVSHILGKEVPNVIISGPSFAQEVAQKKLTAVAIASLDSSLSAAASLLLRNEYFHVILSSDVIGVQVAAACKNVIALGVGLLQGAGFGDNAQALFFTAGLAEIAFLAERCGGTRQTIYELAGIGDLVLTTFGSLGRNVAVGRELGKGKQLEQILRETGHIPEGINTVQSLAQLANRHQLALPVLQGIHRIIFENKPIGTIFKNIFVYQK